MKLVAGTLFVYALIVLGGGVYSTLSRESVASLVASLIASSVLFSAGYFSLRSIPAWGFCGGVVTFLLAIYFAYRFIISERFVPAGVLLLVSFLALFLILLGVFLGLQRKNL